MRAYLALPEGEIASSPGQFHRESDHRILVAEDDENIRRLNTEILIHHGYHVDAARDGAAAWDALQQKAYDLLITDHEMPKVTGFELLQKLRSARMDLPVIMATGAFPKADFARYPWLQPAATLLKPYTLNELVETVREVLLPTVDVCQLTAQPPIQPRF